MSAPLSSTTSQFTLTAAIANYNHSKTLPRAIEAMLSQTRLPDELILVDDASSDNSRAIIEHYAERYPVIRPFFREQNGGYNAAITIALNEARCGYFYAGAADDYVEPTFFVEAMKAVERHPQAGLVYGQFSKVAPDGVRSTGWGRSPTTFRYLTPAEARDEFLIQAAPLSSPSPATVYRRECMRAVGGYRQELASYSDTFQLLAIAARYGAIAIPVDCVSMFWEPTGFSGRTARSLRQMSSTIRHSAALFRTEMADCIPADVVDRWERRSQHAVVDGLVDVSADYAAVLAYDAAVRSQAGWFDALGLLVGRKVMSAALRFYQRRLRCAMVRTLVQGTDDECAVLWKLHEERNLPRAS